MNQENRNRFDQYLNLPLGNNDSDDDFEIDLPTEEDTDNNDIRGYIKNQIEGNFSEIIKGAKTMREGKMEAIKTSLTKYVNGMTFEEYKAYYAKLKQQISQAINNPNNAG